MREIIEKLYEGRKNTAMQTLKEDESEEIKQLEREEAEAVSGSTFEDISYTILDLVNGINELIDDMEVVVSNPDSLQYLRDYFNPETVQEILAMAAAGEIVESLRPKKNR